MNNVLDAVPSDHRALILDELKRRNPDLVTELSDAVNRSGFHAGFIVEVSPAGTPGFERSRRSRIPRAGRSPGRCADGGC